MADPSVARTNATGHSVDQEANDCCDAFTVSLSEFLEQTRPPDPELADLIEETFLEGQIDSQKVDLAYSWLMGKILTQKRAQTSIGLFTSYLLN